MGTRYYRTCLQQWTSDTFTLFFSSSLRKHVEYFTERNYIILSWFGTLPARRRKELRSKITLFALLSGIISRFSSEWPLLILNLTCVSQLESSWSWILLYTGDNEICESSFVPLSPLPRHTFQLTSPILFRSLPLYGDWSWRVFSTVPEFIFQEITNHEPTLIMRCCIRCSIRPNHTIFCHLSLD